jgi:hypothetical protein
MVSAAVGFYGVTRYAECLADFCIADAGTAKFGDFLFLFIRHRKQPPFAIRTFRGRFDGVFLAKKYACEHSKEHPQAIVCADM